MHCISAYTIFFGIYNTNLERNIKEEKKIFNWWFIHTYKPVLLYLDIIFNQNLIIMSITFRAHYKVCVGGGGYPTTHDGRMWSFLYGTPICAHVGQGQKFSSWCQYSTDIPFLVQWGRCYHRIRISRTRCLLHWLIWRTDTIHWSQPRDQEVIGLSCASNGFLHFKEGLVTQFLIPTKIDS